MSRAGCTESVMRKERRRGGSRVRREPQTLLLRWFSLGFTSCVWDIPGDSASLVGVGSREKLSIDGDSPEGVVEI